MEFGVYFASKVKHYRRWRQLSQYVDVVSSWINIGADVVNYPALAKDCIRESSMASVTILYAEPDEVLKGALVEAGCCLSHGRKLIIVEPFGANKTIPKMLREHPESEHFKDMNLALARAKELTETEVSEVG